MLEGELKSRLKIVPMSAVTDKDENKALSEEQILWAYNCMDCLVTAEIEEELRAQLEAETTSWIYQFEMSCLAPAMEMALRGIRIDSFAKDNMVRNLESASNRLEEILLLYGQALGHPQGLNANSTPQLKKVFYDQLGLPIQKKYDRKNKEEKVSVDREALEKLAVYPIANPLVQAILQRRDCVKKLSVLRSGIDSDSRMRFSFNVGGTETGRWSSSKNAFGGGMNAQNVTEEIRSIFIASPGCKIAYIDLEQAESRAVAFLSGDPAYTNACNSGDLHTTVTSLIWRDMPWTGKAAEDRKLADTLFYRNFTFRDMAKRGGHGSNYLGTARTMSKFLKIEFALMEAFQRAYFKAFPGIRDWHDQVAAELQSRGVLTTPFGRRRTFFSRLGESTTLREAVAYIPQSLIADYMNAGVCRLWSWGKVALLAQVHDAVLFEYPENRDDLVEEACGLLSAEITLQDGRPFAVPTEASVGWNWGKATEGNPLGLAKLKAGRKDERRGGGNVGGGFDVLNRRFV